LQFIGKTKNFCIIEHNSFAEVIFFAFFKGFGGIVTGQTIAFLRFPWVALQLKQVVFGFYWALSVFIRIIAFNNIYIEI